MVINRWVKGISTNLVEITFLNNSFDLDKRL